MAHRDPLAGGLANVEARAALSMSVLAKTSARQDDAVSTLDAFLHAREETAADFARSFLSMTPSARLAFLVEEDGDSQAPAPPSLSVVGETWLREKPSAMDEDNRLAAAAATEVCGAQPAALDVADTEDLEEIDLTAVGEVHTGRMVAFFRDGVTTGSTAYDNYVDASGEESDDDHVPCVELDAADMAALLKNASTLDDMLRVEDDDDGRSSSEPNTMLEEANPGRDTPIAQDAQPVDSALSSPNDTGSSDDDTLSLPGLDAAEKRQDPNVEKAASRRLSDPDMREQLRAVVQEEDDVVYTFSLDPLHDYDADLVGESFRRGEDRKRP